ncbi:MAG: helix-turn-helix domain-containing protein [Clostridia bacterium]|nr:helix-turn-helix domain-containing protein [Clostridia bacterium]
MAEEKLQRMFERIMPDLKKEKFYIVAHPVEKEVPLHDHSFLELSYIVRGTVEHVLDGQSTVLSPGDYLIVDYGSRHAYKSVDATGFENTDCLFLPELLDPILKGTKSLRMLLEHYLLHFNIQALVQNPARMVFHDDSGQILHLLHLIAHEAEKRDAGYTALIRCYLIEILLLTMRQLDDAQVAATGQDIGALIIAYVAEHYMEPITLQDLAARLNYSLPYISKRFKNDVGVSFVHYLQNYRVMQGCRLLSSSNKTISEIAEIVGYHDVKFFSEIVKRITGLSPADFRRQRRG